MKNRKAFIRSTVMKILTLNIQHGGGNRIQRIIKRLTTCSPDIIVLTEYRENKNAGYIKESLNESGYIFQTYLAVSNKTNTVYIASKLPFDQVAMKNLPEECKRRIVIVRVGGFYLAGVYFAQKKEKKILFDYIMNHLIPIFNGRGVIIGDFNTGKPYIDEKGKTFYCIDSFIELEISGLIDSWRKRFVDKREYSWYSNRGNGFRVDHVFCTKEMDELISYIGYDHLPRTDGETDHSAMLVEYNFAG